MLNKVSLQFKEIFYLQEIETYFHTGFVKTIFFLLLHRKKICFLFEHTEKNTKNPAYILIIFKTPQKKKENVSTKFKRST